MCSKQVLAGAHGWNESQQGILNSDEKLYAAIPVYAATNEFVRSTVAIILEKKANVALKHYY